MGYGSRALQLLKQYYEMKIPNINEDVVQEPITEIKNVPDEAVGLLEETIGNLFYAYSVFILLIKYFQRNLSIVQYSIYHLQNLAARYLHYCSNWTRDIQSI